MREYEAKSRPIDAIVEEEQRVGRLISDFQNGKKIKEAQFSAFRRPRAWAQVAQFLEIPNEKITCKHFNFSNCQMGNYRLEMVMNKMAELGATYVNLSCNPLGLFSMSVLQPFLVSPTCTIETLNLRQTGVGSYHIPMLEDILRRNKSLRHLYLGHEEFDHRDYDFLDYVKEELARRPARVKPVKPTKVVAKKSLLQILMQEPQNFEQGLFNFMKQKTL